MPLRGRAAVARLLWACTLAAALLAPAAAPAAPSDKPFEIVPGSFTLAPSTPRAGAHADLTVSFDFAHSAAGRTFNDVRTTVIELPAGFAGAPSVPTCTQAQFLSGQLAPECPPASQVGTMSLEVTLQSSSAKVSVPLYDIALTGPGLPAELGFRAFTDTQLMPLAIRPGDGGLNLTTPNIEPTGEPRDISVTIWGVPAATSHDAERGRECLPASLESSEVSCSGGGESAGVAPLPFLANPTECGEPLLARIEAYSWEEPESPSTASAGVGPFTECDRVPFAAEIEAAPGTDAAEAPSGFDFTLSSPQPWGNPETPASAELAALRLALPEGMGINPAAAAGLEACTPAELERETANSAPGAGCPQASKLGTVEVQTPLLVEAASGPVFIAAPPAGLPNALSGLYVLARAPGAGVLVKMVGALLPDRRSGRLAVSFEGLPRLPFSRIALHLRSGQHALLATPAACGSYPVQAELTLTSQPGAPQPAAGSFQISHGASGGACPAPGQPPPFAPSLIAGTLNNAAGSYSPFYLRLGREDGEAQLGSFSLTLPPGVSGRFAAIPLCPEAAIEAAQSETGSEAQASPPCPQSQVGSAELGAGAGSEPLNVSGKAYLAGPYKGAPLSLALVVPALAGPFDLGTVVDRAALFIDPETAQASVDLEPLPQILAGVPLHYRLLRLLLDRSGFIRNPTSCEEMPIRAAATSVGGLTVPLSGRFQAADCAALAFRPSLALSLSGGLARNGHPALRAVLRSGDDEAGIAAAAFTLPAGYLLDTHHIRALCPRQLPPERCPRASRLGHARLLSSLLPEALQGAIYLRAPSHRFPDLIADLRAGQLHVLLHGRTAAAPGGRLGVRLTGLPDLPFAKASFTLAGGRRGIFVNSEGLCARSTRATVSLSAHNGKQRQLRPRLRLDGGC